MEIRSSRGTIDWVIVTIYGCLLVIGWLMLYATTYVDGNTMAFLDLGTPIGKQSIWMIISVMTFVIVYSFDWKVWNTFAYPIYGIGIVLLALVLVVGVEIKGARSWFSFGGFSFQPSEVAKFGTAIALSSFLSLYKSSVKDTRTLIVSMGLLALPMLLILLQPDAGSALIYLFPMFLFYRNGVSELVYIFGIVVGAVFISSLIFPPTVVLVSMLIVGLALMIYTARPTYVSLIVFTVVAVVSVFLFSRSLMLYANSVLVVALILYGYFNYQNRTANVPIVAIPSLIFLALLSFGSRYAFDNFLKPHQQDRINVWLNPSKCDPRGSLYNVLQSKLAIGSGGFQGKGFLQGNMTKLNYVPEQTTDFIFSTVGEEQGFIGTTGVIFLFALLLVRIVIIAERAKNDFIKNYAYCVGGIFFLHFFVNIGMSVGLMPVIGIPLPFLSKGGSSLLGFTILLSVLLKMDKARFRGG